MNHEMLDIYSDYLLVQTSHATATGLSDTLKGELSHDKVSRFLRQSDLNSKSLWHYIKKAVREQESEDEGVLILDDTIEEKPYTDENEVVCWHYSHAKGRHVKGINLLSCLVRYGDVALPIGYEVIKKEEVYVDEETGKERRRATLTKNQLFRELIRQACQNHIKFKYVLADNWFGSKANMTFIHETLKKQFIIGIKSNRCVALSKTEQQKGQFHPVKSLDLDNGELRRVYLKDVPFPVRLLKKVFKNENGSSGNLYLISNDDELEADHLYAVYQKRWKIEEFHKSIKQNASLAKSPTKTAQTQKNHIFASMIAFCKLEWLRLKKATNHFGLKYKLIIRANQIAWEELRQIRDACVR